jgi:allantoinase
VGPPAAAGGSPRATHEEESRLKWPKPAIRWPGGERLALCLCVAFETWPADLGTAQTMQVEDSRRFPADASYRRDLQTVTDREFGERVGIYRLLDIFERHGVRSTFFISGVMCDRFPELMRQIAEVGHEVATENYIHDYSFQKSPEKEEQDLQRAIASVRKLLGHAPAGYLSPGVRPTFSTPEIIARNGYTYWADPQHEELPYTLRVGGRELTVVPYLQYLNDYTSYQVHGHTPRQLGEKWKDAFDCLYAEGENRPNLLDWGMHPFLTGRPYRAQVLDEFLGYVGRHAGVWTTTLGDVVAYWRDRYRDQQVEEWPNYRLAGEPVRSDPAGQGGGHPAQG